MIQNAHDSIKRRAEVARERLEAELPAPRIQVAINRPARMVEILDNGSGMTRDEIDGYLSTIGRSGTDELRQRIREADRGRTVDLIGQFGIGLLSAFIVAERVVLVTKASGIAVGEPGWAAICCRAGRAPARGYDRHVAHRACSHPLSGPRPAPGDHPHLRRLHRRARLS
ncbi:ATP-binding protein [Paractinoplanes rishiriensis]